MNHDLFSPPSNGGCFTGCHFICNPHLPEECAPFFRKRFFLDAPVEKAVIHLCGVGYHELYINGKKAGESLLTPPQTLYDKTLYYLSYDIKDLLRSGENIMVILLGNGLYNCFDGMAWYFDTASWRARPKCMLYGCIKTISGTILTLKSGRDFETGQSPVYYNMLFGGESQDLTFSAPDDAPGSAASVTQSPGGILKPCPEPFVVEADPLAPVQVTKLSEQVWLYDFGKNRAGWVHITASASSRTKIQLRYGELLNEDGFLDTSNIDIYIQKGRFQTDEYILDENHSITDARPHFTYHGFRYVEVSVLEGAFISLSLTSYALYSDIKKIGSFHCSNEMVNKIFQISDTASLSNLVNIPTDCPQREKNGWTGDISLSAEQMCFHYDVKNLFTRWLVSLRDAQRPSGQLPGVIPSHWFGYNWGSGPVWDSALFELPYEIYRYQNDPKPLKENYNAMKKYLLFLDSMAEDHIPSFGLGDWCPPYADIRGIDCPKAVTDTAYYYYMVTIAATTAGLLGLMEDQARYQELACRIRKAFQKQLFCTDTREVMGSCQASQGIAIHFGLLEKEDEHHALQRLVEMIHENKGRLDFGIVGAKTVPDSLARYGHCQLACDLLLSSRFPSYRHWLDLGCTALLEHWDGTASQNHHMFSDICRFFIQYIAGLGIPDFQHKKITFSPNFPRQFTWAQAQTQTPDGSFFCRWERIGHNIQFILQIPDNYRMSLQLQAGSTAQPMNDSHNNLWLITGPAI